MLNLRHITQNRFSRSPQRQAHNTLENHERPPPIGWERRISNTVDPGEVYYTNGIRSQWNFPNQEEDPIFVIAEAERRERNERLEELNRQARIHPEERADINFIALEAERQARLERTQAEHQALLERAEAERQDRIQLEQARLEREEAAFLERQERIREDREKLRLVNRFIQDSRENRILNNQKPLFRNQDGVVGFIENGEFVRSNGYN